MAFDLVARLRIIDNMSGQIGKAMGAMGGLATKIIGVGTAVAGLGAGLSVAASAVSSFQKAMDFEAQLSSIQALTGSTGEEMADMSKLALDMGAATKYSALQAAVGIEELLKAGLEPATVKAGGLEAALNLATAGGLELADAAEIMATSLNAFYKDGMDAATASNILAGTANASATSVNEMKFALSAVGAVAGGVGLSFKDTNAALGVLANKALKGSDAGTSLKTMLMTLQPKTKDQITLFKRLGIVTASGANKFYTAEGKIQSFEKIAGTLHEALKGMTDMQRSAALEVMFGSDAVRAATIIYETGAEGVTDFNDAMLKVTALDVATKKMDNAKGAIEQFSGAIETLQISALTPTMPLIKKMATTASDFITTKTPQITAAVERMTTKAKNYFKTNFIDNQAFRDIPTTEGKIKFVIENLLDTFNAWYEKTGKAHVTSITGDLTSSMAAALDASVPRLTASALALGSSIGSGLIDGLYARIKEHPLGTMLMSAAGGAAVGARFGPIGALVGGGVGAVAPEWATAFNESSKITERINTEASNRNAKISPMYDRGENPISGTPFHKDGHTAIPFLGPPASTPTKRSGGLSRVPMDNYPILAHRDEMVLTKTEADAQRNGNSRGGVMVTGNTFNVRQESDINAIASEIARQVFDARGAVAQ